LVWPINIFHTCCLVLISHVIHYCVSEKREGRKRIGISLNRPFERAAATLGISVSSIYRVRNEERERLRPGEPEERDRYMAMSDEDLNEIRQAIIKLIIDKKPVRLDSILQ